MTLKKRNPAVVQEKKTFDLVYISQLSWDMKEVDALLVIG